jgi:uncharacterized integral membrane protein
MAQERKPVNWRGWFVGILVALVLIVALQNSQEVRVDVLFVNVDAPLIVVILASAAIGAVVGYVAPVLRRHRREERAREKG